MNNQEVKTILMVKGYNDVKMLSSIPRSRYIPDFTDGVLADPLDRAKVYAEYIMRTCDTVFETNDVLIVDFNKYLALSIFSYMVGEAQTPEELFENTVTISLVINADIYEELYNKNEKHIRAYLEDTKELTADKYTEWDVRFEAYKNIIKDMFVHPVMASCINNIDFVNMDLAEYIDEFYIGDKTYPVAVEKEYYNNPNGFDVGFTRLLVMDFVLYWYSKDIVNQDKEMEDK